jgi:hypothetical protein
MTTDEEVVRELDEAFRLVNKPVRFLPDDGDPEFNEHDSLLQSRNRETLLLSEINNAGWDPFCSCSGHGIAYYFPSLARFALPKDPDPVNWYANQLIFHLDYKGKDNVFLCYCSAAQKLSVHRFIRHLIHSRAAWLVEGYLVDEFNECLAIWAGECK